MKSWKRKNSCFQTYRGSSEAFLYLVNTVAT